MPDEPKPRFFVDPSWWLDAIQKVGVPTAILIAAGFGIRAVYIDIVVPAWNRTDRHIEIQDEVSKERENQFAQQTKVLKGQLKLSKDHLELSQEVAKKMGVEYIVAKKPVLEYDDAKEDSAADEKSADDEK